jgi:hypothetical protein
MKNNDPLVQCIHVKYCSVSQCHHHKPHKRDSKNRGCGRVRRCTEGRAISCWVLEDDHKLKGMKVSLQNAKDRREQHRLKMENEGNLVNSLQKQIEQEEINLGINQKYKCPKDCNECDFRDCVYGVPCPEDQNCNLCNQKVCTLHNI